MTSTSEATIQENPVPLDLPAITAGEDYEFEFQILDDNDEAQDTTGWSMDIKGRYDDENGEVAFTLSTGSGITHTPASGRFTCLIAAATTALFTAPYIVWDCKTTDSTNKIKYPFMGTFKIRQPITR